MSEHRTTNSILTAAVVAVYLGLVLAGATPQIYAQAATAKQFSVKDEIESKSNLDDQPDPTFDELVKNYEDHFGRVERFLEDLAKLSSIEKFDPNWNTFDSQKATFHPCPQTGFLFAENQVSHIDSWLVPAIEDAHFGEEDWSWLSDCRPFQKKAQPNWTSARSVDIHLTFDKNEILYKVTIEKSTHQEADSLYSDMLRALQVFEIDENDAIQKVLYANTLLSKANDQISVITRLPRADLDAFLALNAK